MAMQNSEVWGKWARQALAENEKKHMEKYIFGTQPEIPEAICALSDRYVKSIDDKYSAVMRLRVKDGKIDEGLMSVAGEIMKKGWGPSYAIYSFGTLHLTASAGNQYESDFVEQLGWESPELAEKLDSYSKLNERIVDAVTRRLEKKAIGDGYDTSRIADEEIRKIFPTAYAYRKHAEMGTRLKAEVFVNESVVKDVSPLLEGLGDAEKTVITGLHETIRTWAEQYAELFIEVNDKLMERDIDRIYKEDRGLLSFADLR